MKDKEKRIAELEHALLVALANAWLAAYHLTEYKRWHP